MASPCHAEARRARSEQRQVQPLHVGQIINWWLLFGHELTQGELRTFALQRISGLEALKTRFTSDSSFNIRDHLSSGFGVELCGGCG